MKVSKLKSLLALVDDDADVVLTVLGTNEDSYGELNCVMTVVKESTGQIVLDERKVVSLVSGMK